MEFGTLFKGTVHGIQSVVKALVDLLGRIVPDTHHFLRL